MKRIVRVEHVFPIRQYETLRFGEELAEIPEELALNPKFVGKVRTLIMLEQENAYYNYLNIKNALESLSPEEAKSKLKEIRTSLHDEIMQMLQGEPNNE